jgi:hypothetical protein
MDDHLITANLIGGLGNQLFQIAIAYAYSKKLNKNLKFAKDSYKYTRHCSNPNNYYNNIYQKLDFIDTFGDKNFLTINCLQWTSYDVNTQVKNLLSNSLTKNIIFDGTFQSHYYFKEYTNDIKSLFTPSEGIIEYLQNNTQFFNDNPDFKIFLNNSKDKTDPESRIVLCVRRTDYLNVPQYHFPCRTDYYDKAIQKFQDGSKKTYYISTDDIEWCKANFIDNDNCTFKFLNVKNNVEGLFALTLFKNYIIANSSFHWWGSFLSIFEKPRIIAPDLWISEKNYQSIYTENMEVIERAVELKKGKTNILCVKHIAPNGELFFIPQNCIPL